MPRLYSSCLYLGELELHLGLALVELFEVVVANDLDLLQRDLVLLLEPLLLDLGLVDGVVLGLRLEPVGVDGHLFEHLGVLGGGVLGVLRLAESQTTSMRLLILSMFY